MLDCGSAEQTLCHETGIDPTIVRVAWVLFTLVGGSGFLAYLIVRLEQRLDEGVHPERHPDREEGGMDRRVLPEPPFRGDRREEEFAAARVSCSEPTTSEMRS